MQPQPALLAPNRYNGQFVTIHFINDEWGWQLTCWEFGRAMGHKWYTGIIEALTEAFGLGLQLATPQMQQIFNDDVLMA